MKRCTEKIILDKNGSIDESFEKDRTVRCARQEGHSGIHGFYHKGIMIHGSYSNGVIHEVMYVE